MEYSRLFFRTGMLCALLMSSSVRATIEPDDREELVDDEEEEQEEAPRENLSWKAAFITTGKEGFSQITEILKVSAVPALAFHLLNPEWGISKFFRGMVNPQRVLPPLAFMCALKAISLRYRKQIYQLCGKGADLALPAFALSSLFVSKKVSALAGLAAVGILQAQETFRKDNPTPESDPT